MIPDHDLDMMLIDADKADFDDRKVLRELVETYQDLQGATVAELRGEIDQLSEDCNQWEEARNTAVRALRLIIQDPIRAVVHARAALDKLEAKEE